MEYQVSNLRGKAIRLGTAMGEKERRIVPSDGAEAPSQEARTPSCGGIPPGLGCATVHGSGEPVDAVCRLLRALDRAV